ncbi:hypothetical protein BFS06_11585 [Clostridium perfringens]|uniref:Uncharacterized protein n=1 Tax=Clostridium perfringens TaxID=1502 RepID=A0A140GS25_CLOPF|nr:hypothetical protein [Clostridium perfringens]AMN31334.1 hypothetical protein JFP838_pA0418 [Clostridium perfringens]TBX14855.1 hypothetical protein BFS06_11585 [Clostridium perfringens]
MFKLFEKIKNIFVKKPKSKYLVFKDDNVRNLDEVLEENSEDSKINLAFQESNENQNIKLGKKSFNIKYIKKVFCLVFFLIFIYFLYSITNIYIIKTREFLKENRFIPKKIEINSSQFNEDNNNKSTKESEMQIENSNASLNTDNAGNLNNMISISNMIKDLFILQRNQLSSYLDNNTTYVSLDSYLNTINNRFDLIDNELNNLKEKSKDNDNDITLINIIIERNDNAKLFNKEIKNNIKNKDYLLNNSNKYINEENSLTQKQEIELKEILNKNKINYTIEDDGYIKF